MADTKPALILHLAAGGEPLVFALPTEEETDLESKLAKFLKAGSVETFRTKEGAEVTVNFAQVAVAYVDDLQRKSKVFGLH
ncbi:hypothetical protein [Amycolatopsis anabasis]|uniref:hypothetical protein n=1 Tax=Amycolatopsis anabasis TaxID=1840409 RepID=UPI00131C10AB|nr:hypothetical protein [Amycolatopsis anabasis]